MESISGLSGLVWCRGSLQFGCLFPWLFSGRVDGKYCVGLFELYQMISHRPSSRYKPTSLPNLYFSWFNRNSPTSSQILAPSKLPIVKSKNDLVPHFTQVFLPYKRIFFVFDDFYMLYFYSSVYALFLLLYFYILSHPRHHTKPERPEILPIPKSKQQTSPYQRQIKSSSVCYQTNSNICEQTNIFPIIRPNVFRLLKIFLRKCPKTQPRQLQNARFN